MARVLIQAGSRTDIVLNEVGHLLITQEVAGVEGLGGYHWETHCVDLGPLSKERAEELKSYIDRLTELV